MPNFEDDAMRDLMQKIVLGIAECREGVGVDVASAEERTHFTLRVHPDDIGRIIGRQGRTIRALRTLIYAAGAKQKRSYVLDLAGDTTGMKDGE